MKSQEEAEYVDVRKVMQIKDREIQRPRNEEEHIVSVVIHEGQWIECLE